MSKKMAAVISAIVLSGCATAILAPGAEKIMLTTRPADVEGCRPVGSLQLADRTDSLSLADDEATEMRNQALGLGTGADTILVTSTDYAAHASGVAYRCHDAGAARTP